MEVQPEPSALSRRRRSLKGRVYATVRWLHVYISMLSFLAILFFAVTGITLNHPEWTFGAGETLIEQTGELPPAWVGGGDADWLRVAEHFRSEHGVRGGVADYRVDEFEGTIAFRAPGYFADAFIDPETGRYELVIIQLGAVGVLNELHRGAEADGPWRWVIDLSGALLTLLALSGLGILVFLKRFRTTGLLVMLGGCVLVLLAVFRLAT